MKHVTFRLLKVNINCLTDTQRKNLLYSLLISYNPLGTAVSTTSALPDEFGCAFQTRHNIEVTGQDQILIIMQQMIIEKETNQQKTTVNNKNYHYFITIYNQHFKYCKF
jgi:hypothetical protein